MGAPRRRPSSFTRRCTPCETTVTSPGVTTPAPVPDGRSARSQRTREAVVDALLALIREGNPRPTAREIAERADISLRSVYVHFDDLEDLFCVTAQRQTKNIVALIEPVPGDTPLEHRVDLVCTMRARIFEEFGAVRRAAWLQTPCSRTLSDLMDRVRAASRRRPRRGVRHRARAARGRRAAAAPRRARRPLERRVLGPDAHDARAVHRSGVRRDGRRRHDPVAAKGAAAS